MNNLRKAKAAKKAEQAAWDIVNAIADEIVDGDIDKAIATAEDLRKQSQKIDEELFSEMDNTRGEFARVCGIYD